MALVLEPIGIVRSPVAEPVDAGWGDVVSEIHLREDLAPGLVGLADFSHVLVVFWMHAAAFDAATDVVRRPRGRADFPQTGIFAQRARHRPNPIGVSAARLERITGAVVTVRGLDAIDGTPVLDLKPYVPELDHVPGARVPGWIERLLRGYYRP